METTFTIKFTVRSNRDWLDVGNEIIDLISDTLEEDVDVISLHAENEA